MSTDNQNPNAQGPQTGADGQAQTSTPAPQSAGPEQHAGFQKRIDELVAERHAAAREAAELRQMNQQLLMTMAQGQVQQQAPAPLPQVDIDPEVRKQLDAYTQPLLQQQQAQFAQMMAQTASQQLGFVVQGQHPEVAKRTALIWNDAVMKGAHLKGFTPQQALTWARGELVDLLVQEATKGQQAQQVQQFNAAPQALRANSAVAPAPGSPNAADPDLDDDPEKASALYAQRLQGKTF